MDKQDALAKLTKARGRLALVRDVVEMELRKLRDERLSAYRRDINFLILVAYAAGASMGEIKRAYGTKDHRTVSAVIQAGSADIAQMRKAAESDEEYTDWFTITGDTVEVRASGESVLFRITEMEEGEIMLSTDIPRWNDDYTVENPIVAEFDGVLSDESTRVATIAEAYKAEPEG